MRFAVLLPTVVLGSFFCFAACGGSTESEFNDGSNEPGSLGGSSGSLGGSSGGNGSSGGPNGNNIGPGCATSTAAGKNDPVHLVFMIDRSGSMKFNPVPSNKWDSVLAGLTAFFKDSQTAGLFASEQVFPQLDGQNQVTCDARSYKAPLVDMTALPDATGKLAKALTANGPDKSFGTPTTPALEGAIAFAKEVEATGKKTAVVLVTDGEPKGCSSSVPNAATAAGEGLPSIKTYVIGVGESLANLNAIANGGGTEKAVLVPTANPGGITTEFVKALGAIRKAALTCDYAMPAPPEGQTLDVNKVNVQFTPKGGTAQTLDYSADCANGTGWHYDTTSAPKKILICPASCNTLLANADGKIDIVFGCTTSGTIPR